MATFWDRQEVVPALAANGAANKELASMRATIVVVRFMGFPFTAQHSLTSALKITN
jgi:hypothetical protein